MNILLLNQFILLFFLFYLYNKLSKDEEGIKQDIKIELLQHYEDIKEDLRLEIEHINDKVEQYNNILNKSNIYYEKIIDIYEKLNLDKK